MSKRLQPLSRWCLSCTPTYAFEQFAASNTLPLNLVVRIQMRSSSKAAGHLRAYNSTAQEEVTISESLSPDRVHEILSRPAWSVKSLLPHRSTDAESQPRGSGNIELNSEHEPYTATVPATEISEITPQTLQHLHKLSALTPPSRGSSTERRLLKDLRAQLHFVQEIRNRNLRDVEPMGAMRDEIEEGPRAVGLESEGVKRELARGSKSMESTRSTEGPVEASNSTANPLQIEEWEEKWDALGQAPRRAGRFFVVEEANGNGEKSQGAAHP